MSGWREFHQRHGEQYFTPAFNAYLEAQIRDPKLGTDSRIDAWLLRRSWGNHADSCVDSKKGIIQTQADCARDLGLKRQTVNPYFALRAEQNFIRLEGREIFLVDDPEGNGAEEGPDSSPNILPVSDGSLPNDPLRSLDAFLDRVLGVAHPLVKEYQEIREEYKTFQARRADVRGRLLLRWMRDEYNVDAQRLARDAYQHSELFYAWGRDVSVISPDGEVHL